MKAPHESVLNAENAKHAKECWANKGCEMLRGVPKLSAQTSTNISQSSSSGPCGCAGSQKLPNVAAGGPLLWRGSRAFHDKTRIPQRLKKKLLRPLSLSWPQPSQQMRKLNQNQLSHHLEPEVEPDASSA